MCIIRSITFTLIIALALFPASSMASAGDGGYVDTTYENFAKLYWALDKLDVNNDEHVDIYMRLFECQIFKDYSNNEMAWNDIRDSARKQIKSKTHQFPIRFRIIVPIYLTEYNAKKKEFDILEQNQIYEKNMFEIDALESENRYCGLDLLKAASSGYPRGFIMMLPEKISITDISMSPEMASAFIRMKSDELDKKGRHVVDKKSLYYSRDAYLVLNVKVYSLLDDMVQKSRRGKVRAYALAALEKIEAYADRKLNVKLYEKKMRERKSKHSAEQIFKARWEKIQVKREAEKARKKAEEDAKKAAKKKAASG